MSGKGGQAVAEWRRRDREAEAPWVWALRACRDSGLPSECGGSPSGSRRRCVAQTGPGLAKVMKAGEPGAGARGGTAGCSGAGLTG